MNYKVATTALSIFLAFYIHDSLCAQTFAESALLFSRIRTGGTARIQALGGTQNSLGGDVSSTYYNPAGLGMFNRSQVEFSVGVFIDSYSSTYLNDTENTVKNSLNIPNFGIAISRKYRRSDTFVSGAFGINFNITNNFNSVITYKGKVQDGSIIDYFIDQANGRDTLQFFPGGDNFQTVTWLAYHNFLINPRIVGGITRPDEYDSYVPVQDQTRTETIKTSGSQKQWSFSYGLNIQDKIFLGIGLGVSTFNYKSEKTYQEIFTKEPLNTLRLSEKRGIKGSALNITIGGIYRPIDQLQFGLSFGSPSDYNISDNYSASMTTSWNNLKLRNTILTEESATTGNSELPYRLETPMRFAFGATYFLRKKGFVSADVEWFDYGKSKYSSTNNQQSNVLYIYDWTIDNNAIKASYKSSFNVRIGSEYRIKKFYVRAGFNYMPSPYKSDPNGISTTQLFYSSGLGYRRNNFFVDLAIVYGTEGGAYQPYTLSFKKTPNVEMKRQNYNMIITAGLSF